MVVDAPGVGRYESVDVIAAGVYDQSIELDGGPQMEDRSCSLTARAKKLPRWSEPAPRRHTRRTDTQSPQTRAPPGTA